MQDTIMIEEEMKLIKVSVQTLFERHRISLPGILGMTAILLFAYHHIDKIQLALWASMIGLNALLQWYCISSYFMNPTRFKPYTWARLLTLSSGILAIVMGLSVLFFLDLNNKTEVLLVTLFLIGPIFGSAIFAAPYFPIHFFWCIGSMMPLVCYFIFSGVTNFIILGFALLLAALPSALILGGILTKEFKRGLRTHFENTRLIEELRYEKLKVENISRDKSRFLAAVSHDLRQPLHALDLFHSSLKSKLDKKEQKTLLDLASHSSHALGEMLGELMDIARLDAGKIKPELKTIHLTSLLKECTDEIQPLINEKGLKLRIRLPRKECVNSDPILLKRIMRNLLSNAIQHTESGGILLGTRIRGNRIHIEIHDTGSGISETQLPYIFDEFYQVNNPERDREKGLGLGLAIVRRVANVLNYNINVRSQLGKGSCFSISVPLCDTIDEHPQEITTQPEMNVDVVGLFVLVVDDDRIILQAMRELLLSWGCEVLLATSAVDLLAELTTHHYPPADLLISDYRLRNEHTGLEVAEAVQKHFPNKTPTLIISGDVHPEVQAKVKKAGYHWLEKPVRDDVLKQTISNLAA